MKAKLDKAALPPRIFLVGPMGVGKTTIGTQLAQALDRPFYDSDKEIESRTGAAIPLIFELEGEEGFRRREIAVIDDLSRLPSLVLATGGGAVIRPENRAALTSRGYVIYLRAELDKLVERTAKDRNRPLLQTENPRQRLKEILESRDALYQEVADLVLDTGKRSVRDTVRQILKKLKGVPCRHPE